VTRTLYDILDVRPDDDVGRVKGAFRKAAKMSHPDLNVGDLQAPARFTQIVRANAILSDPELRAIYDRMLEFERQQFQPASKRTTILDAPHNFVADAIVVVVLAVVLAGAYTLFTYTPEISIAKVKAVADTAYEPSNVATATPLFAVDATALGAGTSVRSSLSRRLSLVFASTDGDGRTENSHRTASPPLPKARPVFCTRLRRLVRHGQTRPSILRPSSSSQYCSK